MSCPKRIAHGPCGAMWEGLCEVEGEQPCAFVELMAQESSRTKGFDKGFAHNLSDANAESDCALQSLSPSLPDSTSSTFAKKLNAGQFVVTGEVAPPHGVNCSEMLESIRTWKPVVDAINITDNQGATLHLSSLAASRMALDEGIESIFQQTCRDRNRLALQSDLLAAHTLGLRNFLAVTGDNPPHDASVRRMFDLSSTQLLQLASNLNKGANMDGQSIGEPTTFYLGAAAFLDVEPWDAQLARIAQKIEAGARFFQTQAIMDIDKVAPRIEQVQALGAKVIPGVLLLKTPRVITFINNRLEGLHVPEVLKRRIESADDFLAEAIDIAVEQARMIAEVADGIHIMPLGEDEAGIEVIKRAGIR